MQYEEAATWSRSSAQEQPDFGSTPVPGHPGQLSPGPGALWRAFETALAELEHHRGREPRRSGYAALSQKAVYEAGLRAFTASAESVMSWVVAPQWQYLPASAWHRWAIWWTRPSTGYPMVCVSFE
jgi:hypothetical protein